MIPTNCRQPAFVRPNPKMPLRLDGRNRCSFLCGESLEYRYECRSKKSITAMTYIGLIPLWIVTGNHDDMIPGVPIKVMVPMSYDTTLPYNYTNITRRPDPKFVESHTLLLLRWQKSVVLGRQSWFRVGAEERLRWWWSIWYTTTRGTLGC